MPWFQNDCEDVDKFILGQEYLAYIKQQLRDWWDFSKLLLQNTDWSLGRPTAFLPRDHPSELLENTEWSWKGLGVRREFYDYLANLLATIPDQVLVMEDSMRMPTDTKHLEETVGTKFICNGHLYQYSTVPIADAIESTINLTASACLSNGAICTYPRELLPRDREEVNVKLLDDLSRNASVVIVNGFDDCGYVMWEKPLISEPGQQT